MKEHEKPKRSFIEALIAQWPGVVGLGLIAFGVFTIWQTRAEGGRLMNRGLIGIIGLGMAFLAYWAFANKDDGYNF